jgi:hypothetical protein
MRAFVRSAFLAVPCLVFLASPAAARVVSYAPVTGRTATPAVQKRSARHFILTETTLNVLTGGPGGTVPYSCRLVLYDSRGIEEPRDVSPGGQESFITAAAFWEEAGLSPRILAVSNAPLGSGDNPLRAQRLLYSSDAGTTWSVLPLSAAPFGLPRSGDSDIGGPVMYGRGSPIRLGPDGFPFVFILRSGTSTRDDLWAVKDDGTPKHLAVLDAYTSSLIGSDAAGLRFLVRGTGLSSASGGTNTGNVATPGVSVVDLSGNATKLFDLPPDGSRFEGWITPPGDAYFDGIWLQDPGPGGMSASSRSLRFFKNGLLTQIAAQPADPSDPYGATPLFAVPTASFDGAWLVQREPGVTRLSSHTRAEGLVEAWHDVAAPRIEAIHAGASGQRLLIQVHRPRPQADQRIFKDPALALWTIGQPAPKDYDELFLDEQYSKGFVHLDVDTAAAGEPFVFDSGLSYFSLAGPTGGGGGGADVIQEWGVVRGSLRQRLVIPVAARSTGYFGSLWRTDVLLRNADADPLSVAVSYMPNPWTAPAAAVPDRAVTIAPRAILTLADVLGGVFGIEKGSGALLLTPEAGRSLAATSRTYSVSDRGSYGMGVGAVDLYAAIGANFDITFAAGLLGAGFRTNLVATDVSGGGAEARFRLASAGGFGSEVSLSMPAGGQTQLDGLAGWLDVSSATSGSLLFSPRAGQTVAGLVAVDNVTNDPTYFPPDLPAPMVRTIPTIVHAPGSFGAQFRTDLFLFNRSDMPRTVTLAAKPWDVRQNETIVTLTLKEHESRVIRDVLFTLFGREGVARLRYTTGGFLETLGGVRVTSRTYTAGSSGGTYGLLVPPLNEFQSAGPGETLEILGPTGGAGFRTNLALVELSAPFATGTDPAVRIEILNEAGVLIDSFETTVPLSGGVQLNDLFRGRGLGGGPAAALLRVSPFGGLVGAYATTTDNGTNDPAYFGASLAAK